MTGSKSNHTLTQYTIRIDMINTKRKRRPTIIVVKNTAVKMMRDKLLMEVAVGGSMKETGAHCIKNLYSVE